MNTGLTANIVKRFEKGSVIQAENMSTCGPAGITVLFGASGSGKTTVLRCLAGLERPDEGHIQFNEQTWFDGKRNICLPSRERNVGFVPQDYALFPHLTVERNIAYGLDKMVADERRTRVEESLEWLGLRGLEKRLPRELSGGQQQRVALARAVVRRPSLLLLDEPLSALDAPTRLRLRGELRGLLRRCNIPTLLVTHDREEALALGDHLVVLHEGRVVQQGATHEVFSRPSSLAVADILTVETIQSGCILQVIDGLATVAVNGVKLSALAQDLPAGTTKVFVCIRAEDVILNLDASISSSARNRLPGEVRSLAREGAMMRVEIDCGFPMVVLLTKQGSEELSLGVGTSVSVMIKAPQIHLIPRSG